MAKAIPAGDGMIKYTTYEMTKQSLITTRAWQGVDIPAHFADFVAYDVKHGTLVKECPSSALNPVFSRYRAVYCDFTAQRWFQQLTALVLNAISMTFKQNLYGSGAQ